MKITQNAPLVHSKELGRDAYILDDLIVETTDGTVHVAASPTLRIAFYTEDENGKPYTAEDKAAFDESERAKIIVLDGITEAAQLEAALIWWAKRYEDKKMRGSNVAAEAYPLESELVQPEQEGIMIAEFAPKEE